jgi:predicted GTPase
MRSQLINALTGARSVNVSDSLDSETSDIKVTPWTFSRRRFKLVDTPGFDDTKLSDTAVLKKIADFLQARSVAPIPKSIHRC